MKRIYLTIMILVLACDILLGQCYGRYQTEIFSNVNKSTVNYSSNFFDTEHEMDIYTAANDTATNRPLIIFIHGGTYTGGDKSSVDCVDFCEFFAKRGYVTASINYRLADNPLSFLFVQEEQYLTVLKSVADVKAAIRFFRKDIANGNNYGVDENTIFVGGSSAGAITAIHLAYIDDISDLPITSTPNGVSVQSLALGIGGLEGDAGNNGYSSDINAVISFAGAINNVNWINNLDEPLVSIQGDADQTVPYNCGPGLGYQTVLTLCGSNEMHNQANTVNILNDFLLLPGADHDWFQVGNNDARFIQALEFTKDFLYPLLPCNQITNLNEKFNDNKKLIEIKNIIGACSSNIKNQILLYIYDDGTVEKRINNK